MKTVNRIMTLAAERGDEDARHFRNADLGIGQVAGRILGPWIAGDLQRPDPGIATADCLMDASAAAPLERPWPAPQLAEYGIVSGPERRERRLFDTADRVV